MRKSVSAVAAPPDTAAPIGTLPSNHLVADRPRIDRPRFGARAARHGRRRSPARASAATQSSGSTEIAGRSNGSPVVPSTMNMKRMNSVCRSHFSRNGPSEALKCSAFRSGGSTPIAAAEIAHRAPAGLALRRRRRSAPDRTAATARPAAPAAGHEPRRSARSAADDQPAVSCGTTVSTSAAISPGRSSCARWPRPCSETSSACGTSARMR